MEAAAIEEATSFQQKEVLEMVAAEQRGKAEIRFKHALHKEIAKQVRNSEQ